MTRKCGSDLDDAKLLEQVFRDVEPLPGRKISRTPTETPKAKKSRGPIQHIPRRPVQDLRPDPNLPDIRHGEAPGVDKRSAQRLKRGQMEIEGRLDLHGLHQDEAHRALESFLAGAYGAGKRCVLVITGKGPVSQGGGVLRTNVPRWLNEAPNRSRILSFTHATPADGGTGALYVLLKRRRA